MQVSFAAVPPRFAPSALERHACASAFAFACCCFFASSCSRTSWRSAQPVAHRCLRDAVGPGQGGRGQRVGDVVGRRGGEVILSNIGDEEATYRVTLELRRMTPEGELEPIEETAANLTEKAALEMVRYAPRRVILPPGEPQAIRISARSGADWAGGPTIRIADLSSIHFTRWRRRSTSIRSARSRRTRSSSSSSPMRR